MKKGKYEYYNSKLVTKKALELRDEYLTSVKRYFSEKGFRYENVLLDIVIATNSDVSNDGFPFIRHTFILEEEKIEIGSSDFYGLYEMIEKLDF